MAHAVIIPRSEHCISKADISSHALRILKRLQQAGFSAYLVGGSVRDLMLHHTPKDFDIATDAHPEQVRKLFNNSRIIGRRFRLVHIFFGRHIIEVATFRADQSRKRGRNRKHSKHGILLRDNVYGSIEQDVLRRDFTINALYYDNTDATVIDFCQGAADLKQRTLRLIGDPTTRFTEDPVRMLRAVRFAAKLNFSIAPETEQPIAQLSSLIEHISHARLFDEALKLFHHGKSEESFKLLRKYNLFGSLFPLTEQCLNHADIKENVEQFLLTTFHNTDERIQSDKTVNPAFLFAALLWFPVQQRTQAMKKEDTPYVHALDQAMRDVLGEQQHYTAIPRRFTRTIREIWFLQHRFLNRRGKRPLVVFNHPRFRAGYDFLLLRNTIGEVPDELCQWWTEFQERETKP